MKKILTILIGILLITSCKRESYPDAVESVPVFKMSGSLNGAPFSLAAGQNDIYMNSSAIQNEFGVYELKCEFDQVSCSSCSPVFSLLINDNETTEPGAPCTPDVLDTGQLPLVISSNTSDFLELEFHVPNDPGYEYSWDFGDGNTAGDVHNPVHTFPNPGTYIVTAMLEDESPSNHDVIIQQSVLVGNSMFLSRPFNIQNMPGDDWKFSYNESQIQSYLHVDGWEINGNTYFGSEVEIDFEGQIEARLNFTNITLGITGFYQVTFDGDDSGQVPDLFTYQWEAQDLNIGKVEFSYTNANGVQYTSRTPLNQSPDSFLEITAVSNYDEEINGHPAKKVEAIFSLKMVNIDDPDDVIEFENVEAELGFVY
ncbi:MAG: PKD domain-containing protein [Flavobacteriales bacterium]|nr:PKD domain-containing protein [Flavobacteriales bacterium]